MFMGVQDDGNVLGVPKKSVSDMVKNFISVMSNQSVFSPTIYLVPEIIEYDLEHTIIHVHVPPSAEVHSYKKVIYDRVDDADVKVTATTQIAQMYVENANRATKAGYITSDNLEPNPKNPIIASFFRNIGRADRLGSGVRNLFKYSKYYSGKEPEFIEDDVFRIIVPLDVDYSYDYDVTKMTDDMRKTNANSKTDLTITENAIINIIQENPFVTQEQIATNIGLTKNGVRYTMRKLREKGLIIRNGSNRNGART